MHGEALGYPDDEVPLGDEIRGIGRRADVEEVGALVDPVRDLDFLGLLAHVRVLVAPAAEHVPGAAHLQDLYGAKVLAGLALEDAIVDYLAGADLGEVVGVLGEEAIGVLLTREQPDAVAAHQLGRGRDQYRLAEEHREGEGHRLVLGHAALEEDLLADGAVADHTIEVVGDDGADDARGDVLAGRPLLDGLAYVRVDEGGAVLAELQGALAVSAMSPISAALRMLRSPWADSSRKEPVPAEQASFIA